MTLNAQDETAPVAPAEDRSADQSLEPADWNDFKALGHRMIDDMADYLAGLRERPVWQHVPSDVRDQFGHSVPHDGQDALSVYDQFQRTILPFPRGNIHPRFWGWVNGSGVPLAGYADFLASIMNGTVSSSESAAMFVEEQVLGWLKEMFDWPENGDGLLTSGCSMGQILAIAAARVHHTDGTVRSEGALSSPQFTVYCSTETHLSVQKAVELLGIGSDQLRKISVNERFEIDIVELERTIRADRQSGFTPLCVVGNVGTVNTGAIDPVEELVRVAQQEGLWLHLDGAFGAFAYLLPTHRDLLTAMRQADSLVFDLHKWFYLPFDVSCILVRDPHALEAAFSVSSPYTSKTEGGPASSSLSFADRGIEQTRSFRALKVWFTLKTFGLKTFTAAMTKNIDQIHHLNALVQESENLELVSRGRLNVSCFRYFRDSLALAELNHINRSILQHIQVNGIAVPSHTIIDGKFVIRVANNNHRSENRDFDLLVESVRRLGDELSGIDR